jgi:hypothetical protein
MAQDKVLSQIARAKLVGTPFVCITTNDPETLAGNVSKAVAKEVDAFIADKGGVEKAGGVVPITAIRWDISRGFHTIKGSKEACDQRGAAWIAERPRPKQSAAMQAAFEGEGDVEPPPPGVGQPVIALEMLRDVPPGSVVFFMGANHWLTPDTVEGKSAIQAAANLRNLFSKSRWSMLVFLAPQITLPEELRVDTILLDDPLPTPEEMLGLFEAHKKLAEIVPEKRTREKAAAAVTGCSLFGAQQAMYMACKRNDAGKLFMDLEELREFRHRQIEQTKGLKVIGGKYDMSYVAGHDWTKKLFAEIMNGNDPPNGFINVEEINLALAGATGGDNTGVSQDQVMILLDTMEKRGDEGIIFFGVPGCTKSWIVECLGKEYDVDTLQLDLNGLKHENVGRSEENIRSALKVADAVCGGRKLWIATCNSVTAMSDALLRRFTFGIVYFDLLTDEEKKNVWEIQLRIYGEQHAAKTGKPADWKKLIKGWGKLDTGLWSGADIRNCCRHTFRRNRPIIEIAEEANPITRQSPEMLPRYRREAHNRYRTSQTGKIYREPGKEKETTPYAEGERVVGV